MVGKGPVRTGVTAILPRGKGSNDQVFAGWFTLNGNGEMTGTTWVEESGFLEGPSNFIFAASKKLAELTGRYEEIHINRGDGDGPIHL